MTDADLRLFLADANAGFRAAAVELLGRDGILVESTPRIRSVPDSAWRADCVAVDPGVAAGAVRAVWLARRGPPLVVVTGAPVEDLPEVLLAAADGYVEKGTNGTFGALEGAVRRAAEGRSEAPTVTGVA
ncbi:hypothetical protein [Halorarum halobium]|uniref:hypothetical protein n=1 Tax=Halorarum halobium TaxID=3075121 RepID=UPI0028AB52EE|nr:hypothetical protein [Halobaculum sp. XH14]